MAAGAGSARGGSVVVQLEVLGEVQVRRRLMRFGTQAKNIRPAFVAVSKYLNSVEKEAFRTEGASQGHPWAKLKESTLAAKRAAGQRPEILRASDDMRKALTNMSNPHKKRVITRDTLVQGVKGLEYPEILMKKPANDEHREPRKPVDLTEANKIHCVKIVQAWIVLGAERAKGFGV